MADRAETNRLQTLYLDAQRLVRTRRYAIESLLLERTMNSFAVLDSGQSAEPGHNNSNSAGHNTPYNHLELLGNEDLEVMIALDNGTTKALETFKQPLYLLHRRFQTLAGSDLSSAKPVPMSPDALLECFSEAICHDQIAVEIQVVLINLFNQLCFDKSYGQLLDQVNQELEYAGVLPVPEDSPSGADQRQPVAESEAVYTNNSVGRNNTSLAQRQALTENCKPDGQCLSHCCRQSPVLRPVLSPVLRPLLRPLQSQLPIPGFRPNYWRAFQQSWQMQVSL